MESALSVSSVSAAGSVSGQSTGNLRPEEAAVVQALRDKLLHAKQRLREVQSASAFAHAQTHELRTESARAASDEHVRTQRALEQVALERERGMRQQRHICRNIEASQRELQEFFLRSAEDKAEPREDYDAMQLELQTLVDRLSEVCAENSDLRQQIAQLQVPQPALPIKDRASWAGPLQQAFPASPTASTSTEPTPKALPASPTASTSATPRQDGSSLPGTPSTVKGSPTSRAKISTATTSSRGLRQAHDAVAQLGEDVASLEAQLLRERERGASLAQRLDTLRTRGRQLEASCHRSREDAKTLRSSIEEQIQRSAEQLRALLEFAALPSSPASRGKLMAEGPRTHRQNGAEELRFLQPGGKFVADAHGPASAKHLASFTRASSVPSRSSSSVVHQGRSGGTPRPARPSVGTSPQPRGSSPPMRSSPLGKLGRSSSIRSGVEASAPLNGRRTGPAMPMTPRRTRS
mmetsp:Transcript_90603/g.143124  ORF Transcript_90603/g.143124 Transcript_90603/m.143124 type:complete len:466 (-) Transcript_90603:40-1437(-)